MLSAIAAAGYDDIIELQSDITETGVALNKNIREIRGDIPTRMWNGTGPASRNLDFQSGLTRTVTIRNLSFNHSSGGAPVFQVQSWSATGKIIFENLVLGHTAAAAERLIFMAQPVSTDGFTVDHCTFECSSNDGGMFINGSAIQGVVIRNSVFRGCNPGIEFSSSSSNNVGRVYNNTFSGNPTGIRLNMRVDARNNLFVGNTVDVDIFGAAGSFADFNYSGFGQLSGPFGTGNLFGLSAANEFANAAGFDFRLRSTAQARNSGTSLPEITDDRRGILRPLEGFWDMGAYEYIPCGIVPQNLDAESPDAGVGALVDSISHGNWYGYVDACGTMGRSTLQVRSGSYSMLIQEACAGGTGGYWIQNVCGVNIACSYTFCAWIRTDTASANSNSYIALEPKDSSGNASTGGVPAVALDLSSLGSWTQACVTINSGDYGSNFDHLRLVLGNQGGGAPENNSIWFDDMSFQACSNWSPTPSPSVTSTPTQSPTRTSTPSVTSTPSATPTFSSSPTATPSSSPTASPSDSPTRTWTSTATPTATPSVTLTWTPTSTATWSPTVTPTASPTHSPTLTWTPTASPTWTRTITETNTPTVTPTASPSDSPTRTWTSTATPTWSSTTTRTWTPTSTATWSPTVTPTASPTHSPTLTWTQTASPTWTRTITETNTPTVTPTASPSDSPTRTWTSTATPTATPSATSTWTPTSTATWSPTVTPTASPTHSPTLIWTQTASPTWTRTITETNTPTATPTASPSSSPTRTWTSTATPTATPSATSTWTPTSTATWSPTVTPTASPTHSPTLTWTQTASPTWTRTITETNTPSSSPTASPSSSPTPTWTQTASPTWTRTITQTDTPTASPTATPSSSPTSSWTPTATPTATPSATLTWTQTSTASSSPTATPTASPSNSSTPTWTLTATESDTPTLTLSSSSTSTPTFTFSTTPSPNQTATETQTPFNTPTFSATPSVTQSFTETPQLSPTPTVGAFRVTLRIYDSAGNLLRLINGGVASAAVGTFSLGINPWDPTSTPLTISDGAWSSSYDGRDSHGDYLASGSYLIEIESTGSGPSQKSAKNFTVLRSVSELVKSYAFPNPANKGTTVVSLAWSPATQEVDAKVYNQAGELIHDFGRLRGGQIQWQLKNASSGVYLIALRVPGERHSRLLKVALAR